MLERTSLLIQEVELIGDAWSCDADDEMGESDEE